MDHRCLYGHRVSASFTFAIQNRTCPVCGAPTVTLNGYQVARRLASEGGLESVQAFGAVRLIESEWVILAAQPAAVAQNGTTQKALADAGDEAPAPNGEPHPEVHHPLAVDEDVVVDEGEEPLPPAVAVPESRVRPVMRGKTKTDEKKDAKDGDKPAFDPGEEDFFKGP